MPGSDRASVAVLGVPFDNVTLDEAVQWMDVRIQEGGFHQVATANVDFLMHSIGDDELQRILCNCDLVVPDGMPIVWAGRLMGGFLKERVCGADLVPRIAALAAERGYRIFFLGAMEESSACAAERLERRFPGLRIAGRYSPPLSSLEEMDHEEILERIESARPDILLVAFGNPKQEKWIARHRERLQVPLCVGVGGSLDFLSGRVPRAPGWMQSSGLEWLHRTLQEPSRLAIRYLYDGLGLAIHLPRQLAASLLQSKRPAISSFEQYDAGSAMIGVLSGDAAESLGEEFQGFMQTAIEEGSHVVLDLSKIVRIGPDSLAGLARLARAIERDQRQFWLAGAPASFRRVLRAAHLERGFALASSVADALYRIEKTEGLLPYELHAARSVSLEARRSAGIQVEILQDLCRRISSVAQSVEFAMRGFRTRTSAGR